MKDKFIRVAIKNSDDTKVKISFSKEPFTPEEFTSLVMTLLETYTVGLLKNNSKYDVYSHYNKVFGIFLNKILTDDEIYKTSEKHKEFKEEVDSILDRPLTVEELKEQEDNKFAAYLLSRDILVKELGLTEESADILLNKRLNLIEKVENEEKEE